MIVCFRVIAAYPIGPIGGAHEGPFVGANAFRLVGAQVFRVVRMLAQNPGTGLLLAFSELQPGESSNDHVPFLVPRQSRGRQREDERNIRAQRCMCFSMEVFVNDGG